MNSYSLNFQKERFKFSAAHFTIFNKNHAERLHGHNYRVFVHVEFTDIFLKNGIAAPFHDFKSDIEKVCTTLDEYTLIPKTSAFLKITKKGKNINIKFNKKDYSLPLSDVVLMNIENITSELLALYFFKKIKTNWIKKYPVQSLRIGIQESDGQTVYYGGTL